MIFVFLNLLNESYTVLDPYTDLNLIYIGKGEWNSVADLSID